VQTEGATDIKEVAETDDPSLNAFALAQGNDELLADIDDALADLAADGTLAEIGEQYFGVDVSK
jgi:cystine transport system substrate-binding protein